MTTITRRDRMVDVAALVLILLGVGLYMDGTLRLRAITQLSYQQPGPRGVRQLDMADRARHECNAGIALTVIGAAVGAASAWRVLARRA